MLTESLPATADRESLRDAIDALRHSSRAMVLLVLASLRAQEDDDAALDRAFGPDPSPAAYRGAVAGNLAIASERRRDLVARSIGRRDAAARLGVSAQAVSGMLERGALVGLKEGREWRLPTWQLDAGEPAGIVRGLREVATRFPGSVVALSRWVERENPDLDGLTPLAALRRGDVEGVLRLVEAL